LILVALSKAMSASIPEWFCSEAEAQAAGWQKARP
jgi:hypothetical protein